MVEAAGVELGMGINNTQVADYSIRRIRKKSTVSESLAQN
jgi:hypothetical protein